MAPSSSERIDRMEMDGLITPRQAKMLRASTGAGQRRSEQALPRRVMRLILPVGLVLVAVVAAASLVLLQPTGGAGEIQDVSAALNQPDGVGEMNKSLAAVLVAVLFLAGAAGFFLWSYNGLVSREERVFAAWAQVESNLQRRADLTPQLIEAVTRYLRHEDETFRTVTEARTSNHAALNSAIEDLTRAARQSAEQLQRHGERIIENEERLAALVAAQQAMDRSVHAVLATAEAYPELRSSDQFLELQAQLEGTENRLNVTRMRFNELVGNYNSAIRRIPGLFVAGTAGFKRKAYFQAEGEARDVPDLAFD